MVKHLNESIYSFDASLLLEVIFVEDYVQLRFDTCTMSIMCYPTLSLAGKMIDADGPDYRLDFNQFIGKELISYEFEYEKYLRLNFQNTHELIASIKPEDYVGPEMIVIDTPGRTTIVI